MVNCLRPFAEEFLHYLWKFRLFRQSQLVTTSGLPVEILIPGIHNHHAGPDFENCRIRIGDTVWAGNVEIHLSSSDWLRHNHQVDEAYNNVILHVVFACDKEVFRQNGTSIPQLCIKDLIPETVINNYNRLMIGLNWIPCEKQVAGVDSFHIKSWLSRVLIERLEHKSESFKEILTEFKGSWDDAFYIMLARNFGFKTNSLPFELLARSLPQHILSKHKNNALQIEALVFGQAGFLEQKLTEEYPRQLKKEYGFLKKKYSLQPVDHFTWKYMRLRPQNFPGIRLAQFAALILKSSHLFSKILEAKTAVVITGMFSTLPVNNYWNTHYRFDVVSGNSGKQIGNQSINNILINTVAVSLFTYGRHLGQQKYINRAIELLENIPAEQNSVINRFSQIGFQPVNADHTQALMQLKHTYCDLKKCLHCGIGIKLLKQ
ncbi:MAG TPA: DUF2851 family protein [Daejeonella sp.]|nr:DUF2851 family protein [Daejeonella sp.]